MMLERKVELKVTLTVYSEDFKRLLKKVYADGISFEELLEIFIGDLAGGKAASGPDESRLADEWYESHVFSKVEKMSFIQYLIKREFVDPCVVGEFIRNIDLCESAYGQRKKKEDGEGVEGYIEFILDEMKDILDLYEEYRVSCKDCEELRQALEEACDFAMMERRLRGLTWEIVEFTQEFWNRLGGYLRMCGEVGMPHDSVI